MLQKTLTTRLFIAIFALLWGCGKTFVATASPSGEFMLPAIPTAIADIDARREYLAMHYWDNFNFSTLEELKEDSLMGMAIGGYAQVLMMNPPNIIEKSVDTILNHVIRCGDENFKLFTSKLEDCLYSPNSPMRNEEIYIHILRYIVDKAPIEEIDKLRSRSQLEMVQRNRVGEIAANFEYEEAEGERSTLHAINTPYIIIFFNTPSCGDCIRVKQYIGDSAHLTKMVNDGRLTILGLYTEHDREAWHKAIYPPIILNCVDAQCKIVKEGLYDLKAMPTLYLLDSEKIVHLKDRSIEEIESYLINRLATQEVI